MARGIYKGRPAPYLLTERLRILQRYRMSAREIFEARDEVRKAAAQKGGAS